MVYKKPTLRCAVKMGSETAWLDTGEIASTDESGSDKMACHPVGQTLCVLVLVHTYADGEIAYVHQIGDFSSIIPYYYAPRVSCQQYPVAEMLKMGPAGNMLALLDRLAINYCTKYGTLMRTL